MQNQALSPDSSPGLPRVSAWVFMFFAWHVRSAVGTRPTPKNRTTVKNGCSHSMVWGAFVRAVPVAFHLSLSDCCCASAVALADLAAENPIDADGVESNHGQDHQRTVEKKTE